MRTVEYVGCAPFYDLQVPETHNYLAQGIYHHNCGKTYAALCRLLILCNKPEYNGARILVWGPTYNQLKSGTLVSFDELFYKYDMILSTKDGNEPERRLKNNILVVFRNASNPDQTRGHEYALNWLDEAGQMDEKVFRLTNAATRQRRPDGTFYKRQMLITTTPTGKNWLYRYFKDESSRKFLGAEQSAHYETNTLQAMKYGIADTDYVETSGYVEGTTEYDQEILGQYVSYGGNVFYAYNERKHYDRTYAPPQFEHVYGGVDVGLSAPTAITITGVTPAGKFVTFKEFYQRHSRPDVWMPQLKKWQDEFNVSRWYVDSAFDREIATLKRMGVRARACDKKNDGAGSAVGFINSMFATDRLQLMNVPNLRREVEEYEFKTRQSGDEVTFLDKVKPDQDDHAIDSWRYHIRELSSATAAQSYGQTVRYSVG